MQRRSVLKSMSALAVGGQALLRTGDLRAAIDEANRSVAGWPAMEYRTLGRTGFKGSRLVFGCGAALYRGQANDLLQPALDAGINVFDVGYRSYYRDAEQNLGPFLKTHRDRIFVISKAMLEVDVAADQKVSAAEAKQAAGNWSRFLDESLKELGQEHVDAYYHMAANNVSLIEADEMHAAFDRAKRAGKISYVGLSTHENAEKVLLSAAQTGWYDLAQIAITPAGWYDFLNRGILEGTPDMVSLRPVLDAAREAGIGLIGMKAGRHLAGRRFVPWSNTDAYDSYYSDELSTSKLTPFQKSYAYVLAHGLDAVNADMQVWQHLRENHFAATEAQRRYFV